jgi:amidase
MMGEYLPTYTKPSWQQLARDHRATQNENIPRQWRLGKELLAELTRKSNDESGGVDLVATQAVLKTNLLSAREVEITEHYTAVELLAELSAGKLSSFEVTTAFCKRAALAHQLVRLHPSLIDLGKNLRH